MTETRPPKPCQRCGQPVTRKRNKYCSRSCAKITYSTEEERYLQSLDIYPASVAIDKYLLKAKLAGWPPRQRSDISSKIKRLGLTFGFEESHFSRQRFCDLLKIPRWRGKKLAQLGMPFKGKRLRLASKDLRDWLTWNQNKAIAFPYFNGCDPEALEFLLGSNLFAQYQQWQQKGLISPLEKQPKAIAVNGQQFASVSEAARKIYYSRSALRLAANGCVKSPAASVNWAFHADIKKPPAKLTEGCIYRVLRPKHACAPQS